MGKILNFSKYTLLIFIGLSLLLSFQNCGKFNLHKPLESTTFASSLNVNMQLRAPTEYSWNRRYIFLVDMSYSMVSGPCPFDANVTDSTHGFTMPYKDYDPNFPNDLINFNDARARVSDCSVDLSLSNGQMRLDYSHPFDSSYLPDHKTFKGNDFAGNRFKIFRNWLAQMRNSNNSEFLERTRILLIPAGGGIAYSRLLEAYPLKDLKFVPLTDFKIDDSLNYLERIHQDTANQALMPAGERFTQYDPNLETLKMGTTSLIYAYDKIFNITDAEMEKLAKEGALTHSSFKLFSFGDTRTTPLQAQFDKSLSYFPSCADCLNSLETAWGKKQDNELETVDLKLSLIQGLTKYYGSGFFDVDFFNLQSLQTKEPIEYLANTGSQILKGTEYPENEKNVISFLDKTSSERKASSRIYTLNSDIPPYRLANNSSGVTTFKVTHVFILNSNFKVDNNGHGLLDSDGDGLPDIRESQYGFKPEKARTNDLCLDVLVTEPAYRVRCESLYKAGLCDPRLDSDGDGLNECEELTIGTDPFDFDTDGDGIPDSIEVLYGFNPLVDDSKSDSNGDGITNSINLGMGLNPVVLPSQVLPEEQISILLNYIEQQKTFSDVLGVVKSDVFKLDLHNFPLKQSTLSPLPVNKSYLIRPGSKGFNTGSQISPEHQLIRPIANAATNNLIGLVRVIDPDEPQRVYWEMFDLKVDAKSNFKIQNIDLSQFSQLKVIDRVRPVR